LASTYLKIFTDQRDLHAMQAKRPYDHAIAVVKAVLHLTHFGGAIASLLDDYIPSATERDVKKTLEFFGDKINILESRVVDIDQINKDEFSELFKSCISIAQRTHREEKLRAAANMLANLLLKPGDEAKVSYDELDHLIRCVDSLSAGAISALGAIRLISTTHPLGPQQEAIPFRQLRARLQMDASLLRSLVSELTGFHLASVQETTIRGYAETEHDDSLLTISPIGKRLVERFIEGDM
jgi:hypothetical protein